MDRDDEDVGAGDAEDDVIEDAEIGDEEGGDDAAVMSDEDADADAEDIDEIAIAEAAAAAAPETAAAEEPTTPKPTADEAVDVKSAPNKPAPKKAITGKAAKILKNKARVKGIRFTPTLLEMSKAPRVIKVVHPDDRITSEIIQPGEKAFVIATRARQIERVPTAFVDTTGLHDPITIAEKEFNSRRSPFIIRRIVGQDADGTRYVEDWRVREMVLPP